jgi:hypothetical protein
MSLSSRPLLYRTVDKKYGAELAINSSAAATGVSDYTTKLCINKQKPYKTMKMNMLAV